MEAPYGGRANIIENFDGIEIIIPAKKNKFLMVFLPVWLFGWAMGEFFVTRAVLVGNGSAPDLFMIVWLCGWTFGGFMASRTFFWTIAGKEVIKAGQGALTVDKRGALFYKAKTYDLRECKNFRAVQDYEPGGLFGNRRSNNAFNLGGNGTIKFDYGMQTVKFADGMDEPEANFILQKLRDKKYIS